MSGFGAKAYSKIGLETDVITGEPHKLVLMLFDGALLCIQRGRTYLDQKRIAEKCQALGAAIEIVDMGLRASVDPVPDPEFAARLLGLYRYIIMRLLQANARNDVAALEEARKILGDLRAAWLQIAPAVPAGTSAPEPSDSSVRESVVTPARRMQNAYQA